MEHTITKVQFCQCT